MTWVMALPLIGVIIGGVITGKVTYFTQKWAFERQKNWEREKLITQHQREQEKLDKQFQREQDKINSQFTREQLLKKLDAYNKILQVNNSTQIIEWNQYTGESKFIYKPYDELIRPLLYEYFHLLEEDIAIAVTQIDHISMKWEVLGEGDEEDDQHIRDCYNTIIDSIRHELKEFRIKYIEKQN